MVERGRCGRVGQTAQRCPSGWPWSRYVGLVAFLASSGLLFGGVDAAEHPRPFHIGALTSSWGPTPSMVGLRDGLVELGYLKVERGALISYGADYYASGKQATRLVGKILKGAKPADLPVEVNPKIEFAINLKTVNALGLNIVPEVLYQADKIVR